MGAGEAMVGNTVTVRTKFGTLTAPRGFGANYVRVAEYHLKLLKKSPGTLIESIRMALALIGYDANGIEDWDAQKRVETHAYAMNVHLRASDNPIPKHPKLQWLPDPWQGNVNGSGLRAMPTPVS